MSENKSVFNWTFCQWKTQLHETYFCPTATDEVKKFLTLAQPAEELDPEHTVRHLHDGRRRQGRERAVGNGRHLVPVS
jgi:hypothetical protein